MAKKSVRANKADSAISPCMQGIVDSVIQAGGSDMLTPGDVEIAICIPVPSLSIRYMLQATGFPLGKVIQLTGEEGSCKTALLCEMMRWHYMSDGLVFLAQNENKDASDLRRSIINHNPLWQQRFAKQDTTSMNEWQRFLTSTMRAIKVEYAKKDGVGQTFPVLFAVDSLTATATESELEALEKEGCAERGFAILANLISRYMKGIPRNMLNHPFTIVGTNHLKPGTDQQGLPKDAIPGGKSVKFMETYEVKLKRISDIDKAAYSGVTVEFTTTKNSTGQSRRKMRADMLWWMTKGPDGKPRQETAWDWDRATIELLLSFENARGKRGMYKELQSVCDIRAVSKVQKKVWSNALGIPQDAPKTYREAGAMLEARPDLLDQLYPLLGIIERPIWDRSIAYLDAKNAESERMAKLTADRVKELLASGVEYLAAPTIPAYSGGNDD